MRYTYRYRSFFWPAILILGGVVALLVNTGQIPVDRRYQLVNLWPVGLVVIGLELIILRPPHFKANVQLNPGVAWAIRLNSGATTTTINVAHVHVTSVTLNSGAGRDDITLGPASGLVPVEINGGALTVHLHRPSETEATIEVSGGAVSLDADGRSMHAIGHLTYTSSGFSGAANGYRIKVNGGACTVTLDTTTESGQARFSRAGF